MSAERMETEPAGAAAGDSDEILAVAARRDRQAFVSLYDRYVARVERYVALRIGPAEVEDLVSVTFERALSRIHSFNPGRGTFAGWLFAVAHNAVVDRQREGSRVITLRVVPEAASAKPGPEAVAEQREVAMWVRGRLAELPADQRDALALRYSAGLTFAEVGRSLGRSEDAAKMLVQRGLAGLRAGMDRGISP